VRTFNPVLMMVVFLVLTGWFSVKTGAGFQPMGEASPTLVSTIGSSFWTTSESKN